LAFAQFQYDTGVYSSFLKDCLRLDNAIHEALGHDRIDEIKSSTTGMANITAHMIRVFFRNRYGVLTMAKLIQLKDSLKSLGGRDAQGYFAHAARVHDIFEVNGQTFNELEKQECAALAISYDERLNRFYQQFQDKFLTMASRTYAAMVTFILLHDASSPRPESAYSARANKPNGATASATHGKHDDNDDDYNSDYDDDFDQQSYQDGFAAGMSAASVTTRSTHFGPNLDKRLDTLETTIAKLTDAITNRRDHQNCSAKQQSAQWKSLLLCPWLQLQTPRHLVRGNAEGRQLHARHAPGQTQMRLSGKRRYHPHRCQLTTYPLTTSRTISTSLREFKGCVDMIISPTLRILPRYISATFSNNLEGFIIYPVYYSPVSDSQSAAWR
jgi:hypothetical protein